MTMTTKTWIRSPRPYRADGVDGPAMAPARARERGAQTEDQGCREAGCPRRAPRSSCGCSRRPACACRDACASRGPRERRPTTPTRMMTARYVGYGRPGRGEVTAKNGGRLVKIAGPAPRPSRSSLQRTGQANGLGPGPRIFTSVPPVLEPVIPLYARLPYRRMARSSSWSASSWRRPSGPRDAPRVSACASGPARATVTMISALGVDIRLLYTLVFGLAPRRGPRGRHGRPRLLRPAGMGEGILDPGLRRHRHRPASDRSARDRRRSWVAMADTLGRAFLKPCWRGHSRLPADTAGPASALRCRSTSDGGGVVLPSRGPLPPARSRP